MASKIEPGSDGLYFSPHLGGRICPANPEMRGAWIGVSWSHTQMHFFRAMLESVAFEYAYYLRILRELLPTQNLIQVRVVGGGARSQTWNQIKADVLGIPYQSLRGNEFGTWGAAMIAGKAAGVIPDLAEHAARTVFTEGPAAKPNNANHKIYEPLTAKYIEMQSMLGQFFGKQD
jgi:xylulokinase